MSTGRFGILVTPRRIALANVASTLYLLSACGANPTGPGGDLRLEPASALTQFAVPGEPVIEPPTVLVVRGDGRPVRGVAVSFHAAGGGRVGMLTATTDKDGLASARSWTIGTAEGVQVVEARVQNRTPVVFRASVTPAAMTLERSTRNATVGIGSHQLDPRSIQLLLELGVRQVRTTMYWSNWKFADARDDFRREIRAAVAAGLEPLVVVHTQPAGGYDQRKQIYADFARFIAERVAEFPEVRYWQLWNEMDSAFTDIFGAGRADVSMPQRGRNYAEMLALAYPAIKQANPNAVVVTGGIASAIDGGFLDGMYAGGARYDVLAIHTYGLPLLPAFTTRGRLARAIMRKHNDSRPLWNTEFGLSQNILPPGWAPTPATMDAIHLEAWKASVEWNTREKLYDRMYGHVLKQGGDFCYDLVRSNGTPRPAYLWLQRWLKVRDEG